MENKWRFWYNIGHEKTILLPSGRARGVRFRLVAEYDQLREKCKTPVAERLKFLESHLPLVLSRDDATVQYVTCLNDLGRHEEALDILSKHRFHPWEGGEGKVLKQYTRAHLELGFKALGRGDFADALEHADKSFATPQNLGEAYHLLQAKADVNYLRGKALQGLGRAKDAKMENLKSLAEKGLSSLQSVQGNR